MLTKTEWLIEWTNIVNCNGYLCDWTNDAKSVQWLSFLNPSHNQWATNLIQEDHSFNHSSFVFYNHWKWDWSIIWLSVQIKESINQSIHELINDAHFMQWITIIRLSLLTNWYSATRILYIQSFFPLAIFFCFYLVNAWLRDWIDAYSACYYLSRSSKQQDK